MRPEQRIICALDVDTAAQAVALTAQLCGHVGVFKAGLQLVTAEGTRVFRELREAGAERIFYDGKLHDIPNTVAGAMRSVVRSGVWCVTLHASGGSAMLSAAVEAATNEAARLGVERPRLLAVTALTSVSADRLRDELMVSAGMQEYVAALARMAHAAGCDGVIASPHEIETVRQAVPDAGFLIVTPGVRPAGADAGDQARVMTPGEAVRGGADYLVIGRPIVSAADPVDAARSIAAEIAATV